MGFMFSKPKGAKKDAGPQLSYIEKAQLELKKGRDRMQKQTVILDKESALFYQRAAEMLRAGRKEDARRFLALKKMKDTALATAQTQLGNMERMVIAINTERENQEFLTAMATGNAAMKQLQQLMPIEKAQQIMEESQEAIETARELDELIVSFSESSGISQSEMEEYYEKFVSELPASDLPASVATTATVAAPAPAPVPATVAATTTVTTTAAVASSTAADDGASLNLPDVPTSVNVTTPAEDEAISSLPDVPSASATTVKARRTSAVADAEPELVPA